MRSQSLPMSTIVLIIIVLVVLVAVLLFLFTSIGQGRDSLNEQTIFSKCHALCVEINSKEPTVTAIWANVAGKFCVPNDCSKYTSCTVQSAGDCKLTCTGSNVGCT